MAPESVFGMVIVSVEVFPELIDVGENALVIPSGAVIVRSAVVGAVFVTFCVSVSALAGIVLVYVFVAVAVTGTVIEHVPPAATLPPLSVTVPPLAATVPAPHVVDAVGVDATVTPLGNVSVNIIPLSATEPVAVLGMVIVSVDVPPEGIDVGENALVIPTGAVTVRLAVAGVVLVTFCVSVSEFGGIVLVYVFVAVAVTGTVIEHVPPAATLPLLSVTVPPVATTVPPPHVVDAVGVEATVTPLGNVSVNVIPLSATEPAAVFGIMMVSVDVPPDGIDVGENAFVIATAVFMLRFAVAGVAFVTPCVSVSALAGIVLV
jgi:hypothetical protein